MEEFLVKAHQITCKVEVCQVKFAVQVVGDGLVAIEWQGVSEVW